MKLRISAEIAEVKGDTAHLKAEYCCLCRRLPDEKSDASYLDAIECLSHVKV
jgi:hypothetical protein